MSVFELNNTGIYHMQQGSYPAAAHAFQGALRRLRDMLISKNQKPSEAQCSTFDEDESNMSSTMIASVDLSDCPPVASRCHAKRHDNFFSLFDRSFALASDLVENDILASTDVENMASETLLYNLALALHKKGLTEGNSRNLQQALSLYQNAGSLVEFMGEEHRGQNLLIFLAILNNMAHIYAEIFDTCQASRCIDALRMALESDECDSNLNATDYDFFVWSFFLIPEVHIWLAPAA